MSEETAIHNLRRDYDREPLVESDLDPDPVKQFRIWFEDARLSGIPEPNAMTLGTADRSGNVSCRTVLLKAYDERGFVFFTNYGSRKAHQIAGNPRAAVLFPWVALARQVEIAGEVEKISAAESLAYFVSRPFGSRLGAWVSD
ncbi:MAG: pyridoxal 5'-phosphate synthase, partial [Verrucomicrobiota bacterium]